MPARSFSLCFISEGTRYETYPTQLARSFGSFFFLRHVVWNEQQVIVELFFICAISSDTHYETRHSQWEIRSLLQRRLFRLMGRLD